MDHETNWNDGKILELHNEINKLSDSSNTLVSKSVFDEEVETLTYRLTFSLAEKVIDVANCGQDQTDSKENNFS